MIKERDEESGEQQQQQDRDTVRQKYESMTYDDLAQRMAENYKQLSAVLGTNALNAMRESTSSTTRDEPQERDTTETKQTADNNDELNDDDDESVIDRDDVDDKTKRAKMTKLFCRAASTGDVTKVTQLLRGRYRPYIDIDARDEDGTTPLIYAACFGKVEIAQALLDAGAKTDVQDSFGWSALMWATNNNQDALVKVLLENGASSHTKSAKGRTVFDFVNTDNQKIVEILATNPRDSVSSTSSILGRAAGSMSSGSSSAGDYDFYYQSTLEGYDHFMTEEADRRRKLLETAMALADGGAHPNEEEDDDDDDDLLDNQDDLDDDGSGNGSDIDEPAEFIWDKCLPDQMFVFSADNLPYILNTIITDIQLPVRSRQEICVPANVIFLSARFAHYFSGDELLQQIMHGAVERISTEIKSNARNVHILAFWITNATQLLYYLKKDGGLVVATAEHQLRISELVSEIYNYIINDAERRLAKILTPSMLEHEQIPGMEDVNFADDWQRFFRRSSRRSVVVPPDGGLAVQMKRSSSVLSTNSTTTHTNNSACAAHAISPQSITSLLTSTLYVLQSYGVHPAIIVQALAQFFHYMSCELFNRILTNKKLLCRSKALQIRMNMSQIEDWITQEHLPSSLVSYLEPTNQLLQLLQCLTHLQDLASFIHTVKKFDALNALQVKRCVTNYRYEVNEPRLPEEIEKYAIQLAEDTVRFKQARSIEQLRKKKSNTAMARTQSVSLRRSPSRRESVTNFMGSIMSSVGITTSNSLPPTLPSEKESSSQQEENKSSECSEKQSTSSTETKQQRSESSEDEEEERQRDVKETRDSKFMLPFSVPTTAHMVSITGWAPDNIKRQERMISPVIPDEWMDKLDNANSCIE
ncbi:hypothetical protein K492DRAFT_139946 [Lichtheimia hyalospora FSU 10163]|nr:hypothetical protein K492DRAFT_139946 [Lichtheimia hyalospora FSU 10163]